MTFDWTSRPRGRSIRGLPLCAAMLAVALSWGAVRPVLAAEPADTWPELARDIFNGR